MKRLLVFTGLGALAVAAFTAFAAPPSSSVAPVPPSGHSTAFLDEWQANISGRGSTASSSPLDVMAGR